MLYYIKVSYYMLGGLMAINGYVTLTEASEYLGVSTVKVWSLVKSGKLITYENPLDMREKLVRCEDVEKLKEPRKSL